MTAEEILKSLEQPILHQGASPAALVKLERLIGRTLPDLYLQVMAQSNGIEGFLNRVDYVILWPVEQLPELNDRYGTSEYAPGLFLFGSNGGDAGYAFDTLQDPMSIKEVPFIGMSPASAKHAGRDFDDFISQLKKQSI